MSYLSIRELDEQSEQLKQVRNPERARIGYLRLIIECNKAEAELPEGDCAAESYLIPREFFAHKIKKSEDKIRKKNPGLFFRFDLTDLIARDQDAICANTELLKRHMIKRLQNVS